MRRLLLALALLIATFQIQTLANRPQPLSLFTYTGSQQFDRHVDEQSWWLDGVTLDPQHTIVNPTNCTWDINDNSTFTATGFLDGGATTSRSDCHIADIKPVYVCNSGTCGDVSPSNVNWIGLQVLASEPTVTASVCLQPDGRCFTATPTYDASAKLYTSNICVAMLYDATDPAVVNIDGSQALDGTYGRGVPTTITRSVTNSGNRSVKTVWARWGLSSDVFTTYGCPAFPQFQLPRQRAYPFLWMAGQ